jgi:hypothetical protein
MQCSAPTPGSGTQTTNGICISVSQNSLDGYLYTIDNENIKKRITGSATIQIQLFSTNYQPYDSQGFYKSLLIESNGGFAADFLENGTYNLLANDTYSSSALLFSGLSIHDSLQKFTKELPFSHWGTIHGTITDSSQLAVPYKGVFILGTPFFTLTDSLGEFNIGQVPSGSYSIFADYFTKTSNRGYTKIKGIHLDSTDAIDTYTDSLRVSITEDSLSQQIKMKL